MGFNSAFNSSGGSQILTDLEVDSPTIVVDETNNRLGIGTAVPRTTATVEGAITLKEQAAADTDTAAYGQVWVKTATPNQLYFTTDAGDDIQLTSGTATAFVGDITGVTAGTGLSGGGTTGALTVNLDSNSLTEAAIANGDYIMFNDATDSNAPKREALADLVSLLAGTAASTGLAASSSVLSVSDLHPVGVDGAANQLVTDDGDGTVTSEANLQFDGTGLKIKEAAAAAADTAAYGQLWIKNEAPCELYFTTDAGDDIQLTDGTSAAGGGAAANDANLILHMQTFGR